MYFIENGTVSIRIIQDNGIETEISKFEKGQYFGELALVTHRPRAASVYAENTVKVACKCLINFPFIFLSTITFMFVV
jgi:cAMP-dependent protein kinase regulator